MNLVHLFPVVLPQWFKHTSSLSLILSWISPLFLHFYQLAIPSPIYLFNYILLRSPPRRIPSCPRHHFQRLYLTFTKLLYIGGSTINDLALWPINNDVLPFFLIILIPNDSINIPLLFTKQRLIKQQYGYLRWSLLRMPW